MSERLKLQNFSKSPNAPWGVLYVVTSFNEKEAVLLIGEKIVLPVQIAELEGLEVEIKIHDVGGAAVSEMDSGAFGRGSGSKFEGIGVHGNG
jgi:hypothetical protein